MSILTIPLVVGPVLRNPLVSQLRRLARPLSRAAPWLLLAGALAMVLAHAARSTFPASVREGFEEGNGEKDMLDRVIDNTMRSKKNEQDIAEIREKMDEASKMMSGMMTG